MKEWSIDEWKYKLINDSPFERIPITHQYWNGFFVYEYLVNNYGINSLIDVMFDFPNTFDFNFSMNKILGINIEQFYDTMSLMLFNLAKKIVV